MTTNTPPNDPPAPDDKLPGEAELAALYHQLPRNEPDPALDAAVLRAAAQALDGNDEQSSAERGKAPHRSSDRTHPKRSSDLAAHTQRRRVPRWLVGLSTAASLVLVAGLAWRMHEMPVPDSTSSPSANAADAMRATAPVTPKPPDERQLHHESLTRASQAQAPAPMKQKTQTNHQPPPAPARPDLKPAAPAEPAADAARKMVSDMPSGYADAAETSASRQSALQKGAAPAPKQAASADPASLAATPVLKEVAAPAPAASRVRADTSTAAHPGDTPEQELEKIQRLMARGRKDEARLRLQAFHHAHPQRSVPADLRGLLVEP